MLPIALSGAALGPDVWCAQLSGGVPIYLGTLGTV